jgi:hypothetical protein
MSDETETTSEAAKQKRTRSPAYPAIDLKTSLDRASALWSKVNRHAAPVDTIAAYWGYDKKSSRAISEASAMIKFGLLADDGIGLNRTVKLTESGIKLSYNPEKDSQEYMDGLKKAALLPAIHQEIWQRYEGNLPDDAIIKRHLVVDKKFNEQYVDDFISQFRRTIEFANLSSCDKIESAAETEVQSIPMTRNLQENRPPVTMAAPIRKPPQFYGGAPAVPLSPQPPDDLSLPLESGRAIRIPKMTEDDYNLFLETIQLWKRRIIIKPNQEQKSQQEDL